MRVHWPQKAKEDNLHHLTNATYRCVLEMERVLTDSEWAGWKAATWINISNRHRSHCVLSQPP